MIPDSLVTWRYKTTPVFEIKSSAGVTAHDLEGRMENSVIGVNGFSLLTILSVKEKVYRTGNRTHP